MTRAPFRDDLPHGVAFVLAALMGAGVGAVLIAVREVAGWWP